MAIITKPASIEKNSPAEISLDKSALAAVASVAASAYYSDSANWKEVFIYYKSSVGNQREVLKFNATIASPVATFLVSEKARDIFQVQKIVIVDFDNGSITVPRSQLTVADFDVDMTPVPSNAIVYNSLFGGVTTNSSGAVIGPSSTEYSFAKATGVSYIGQDFTFTFNITPTLPYDFFCAISDSTANNPGTYAVGFLNLGTPNAVRVYTVGSVVGPDIELLPSGNTLKIQRLSGNLTLYVNNVLVYTINGYNPSVETFPSVRPMLGTSVTSSTVVGGSSAPSVVWDFASRPAYSLNAQNEIVGSSSGLSYDTSTILFSLSEYTIPANGLELKMVANNGWAIADAHFFGVCNPSETVFNGFYYAANIGIPSFGVNNILQTPYVYPSTPEVEFKIIIKTTQTEFYVNGVLQSILAPVSNGSPTVKVATRFDSDINIKSSTITEL